MKNRDNLHKKHKKDPNNDILKLTYKNYRNYCNSQLKKAKQIYEKQLIIDAKGNKKHLWTAIKEISGLKKPVDHSTNLLSGINEQSSVNEVNFYFANIGNKLAEKLASSNSPGSGMAPILDNQMPSPPSSSFVMLPTDEDEVLRLITNLKQKCATGLDQISGGVIKRYSQLLARPLTHICNLALSTGEFPQAFKTAVIKPIHKSGERDRVENFRPISILPTLSKILERIMNTRLTKYLESNNLLSPAQFGFRQNRSTNDAVTELTNSLMTKLDEKKKCLVVFLDLAKAFDTVSIPLLTWKLEQCGIRGIPLKLFSNYLSNRKQRVKIGNVVSEDQPIICGVPQGSILGPSLFLVYINGLCNAQLENGKILTFADDTALFFSGDSWDEVFNQAQTGVNKVSSWLKDNILTLNVSKTNYIAFALRPDYLPPSTLNITIHSCASVTDGICSCPTLKRTDQTKYLGVTMDQTLTFKHHTNTLVNRLRKMIYIFRGLKHVADRKIILMVYKSLAQSVISYCITSWGGAAKTYLLELERAQRAILKVSAGLPFRFPTTDLYSTWGVLTVRQLMLQETILLQHSLLTYNPNTTSSKRRKGKVCRTQSFRTKRSNNFFIFLGPYIYNLVNKELAIYPLPRYKCKRVVSEWLKTLSYDKTEQLLKPLA